MLYYKADNENFSIPDYYISDYENVIIEYEDEFMKLTPNDSLLLRGGVQMNLPFENFVLSNKSNLDSTKDVFKFKRRHTPYFELNKYQFKPNITKSEAFKNENQYKMFKQMHHTWFNLLKEEFDKSYFNDILKTLYLIRENKGSIRPDKEDYFKQFLQPLEDTKVIFINNEYYENNVPFLEGITPVSTYFKEEILKASKFKRKESLTLNQLNNIGVLGLNASPTSSLLKKNQYFELWKPFFNRVIEHLENYFLNPVVFVLVGKQVLYYEQNIRKHQVITIEHPSKSIKETGEWNGQQLFKQINNILNEEIRW